MNYILNSLEEIRKVYTPDIECLNTHLDWIPFTFCGIENTILESMRFFQYYYYGDDYEKEDLCLKDFNFKNKSHRYSGLNYDYLLKNIDLESFKTELEKSITKEGNYFIFTINEQLDKARSDVEFKKRLRKNVESLVSSSKFLKSILDTANEFDKILINRFIVSYRNAYDSLKIEHEQDILPTVIFKPDHFKTINDLEKPINTDEFLNKNNQKEYVGLFGNSNHIKLANLYIGNKINHKENNLVSNEPSLGFEFLLSSSNEMTNKTNPFPDIFKSIDSYNCFIEYITKHIIDPFPDYSYLFQRLLHTKLIHKLKHFEFMEWLFTNNFISENKLNEFKVRGNFSSLNKNSNPHRENNFNSIFKL